MKLGLPGFVAMSAAITILVGVGILERAEQIGFKEQQRTNTINQLSTIRARLEESVNSRLFLTEGMTAYIANRPNLDQDEFQDYAKTLTEKQQGIKLIELSKNTIISHVYPPENSVFLIGKSLLQFSQESKAIKRALQTKKSVFAGPVNWGKTQVFIYHQPVFLDIETEKYPVYWGMTTIVIDRDILFEESGINELNNQERSIEIALRGRDGLGALGEVFYGNPKLFEQEAITLDVYLPNGSWQLAAIPVKGWQDNSLTVFWIRFSGTLLAGGTGILVYIWMREPKQLRQTVKRATIELKESEERFRILSEATFEGIVIHRDGKIIDVNQVATDMVGYNAQELIGKNLLKLMPKSYRRLGLKNQLSGYDKPYTAAAIKKDGSIFSIEIHSKGIYYQGKPAKVVAIRDISHRQQTEAALLAAKQQLQAVLEAVPGFVCWVSSDLHYLGVNPRLAQICKLPLDRFIGQKLGFTNQEQNLKEFMNFVTRFFAMIEKETFQEVKIIVDDRERVYLMAAQKYDRDRAAVFVGIDITERNIAEAKLRYYAFHDVLTTLANRAMFMLRLQLAVKRSQWDRNYLFAVLFLDLDRFKVINDSLGHTMGDRVLIAMSQLLQAQIFDENQTTSSLRDKDFLSRFGGDEFTILLDDIESSSEAINLAEKIQTALKKPLKIDHHEVFLSSSIGIVVNQFSDHKNHHNEDNFSLFSTEQETPPLLAEDIMRDVDIAMYWAKAMGKGRYAVFYPGMRDRALKLMQLETDLRQAIEHEKLLLHYQPIVSLQTNRISGFEALVRWPDPLRGMVPPLEFIGVAEETGLIIPLGSWVIQQACQQMRLWQTQFPASRTLTMSVNLSGHQFTQSDLIENIDEILQQTGLKPDSLKLEITETSIAESVEYAGNILKKLRDLGIKLCIDDFGTGYSSLSRLHELPLDTLKIDRTFVSRLGKNGENSEMLEIILTLAHNLNMDAVAEGIETIEQLNQLRKYNCEYGQGYFFSKPVDSKVATSLLEAQMKKS